MLPTEHRQHRFWKKQVFAECLEVLRVPTEAVDNSVRYNKPCSLPCGLHVSQHTPLVDVRVVSFHTGVTSAPIKPTRNIDHVCNVRQKWVSANQVSSMYTEQEGPQRWREPVTAKCKNNYNLVTFGASSPQLTASAGSHTQETRHTRTHLAHKSASS